MIYYVCVTHTINLYNNREPWLKDGQNKDTTHDYFPITVYLFKESNSIVISVNQ